MNLCRPPFQIIQGQTPINAAADIVATFSLLEYLPQKVSFIFKTVIDCLDLDLQIPLIKAGFILADIIDNTSAIYDKPYHNNQHCCEVILSSYFLSLISKLNRQETLEIVFASLIHDYQHDGKPNGDIPFRLERNSASQATPYLKETAVEITVQQKITALTLSTNTAIGLPIALASLAHHTQGAYLPEIPISAPELSVLSLDRMAATQALILCKADILPSIALTLDYSLKLQKKLSIEWGTYLGLEDKMRFIENQRHLFVNDNFFNTNIDEIKLAILNRLHNNVEN